MLVTQKRDRPDEAPLILRVTEEGKRQAALFVEDMTETSNDASMDIVDSVLEIIENASERD